MKDLLFIGHSYHQKTRSVHFLHDILRREYNLTFFYYDPYAHTDEIYNSLPKKHYDVCACFQIFPPRKILNKNISFTAGIFFPMYDAAYGRNAPIWRDYSDFLFINFSKTLHDELSKIGLNSRYIQYWPEPKEITSWGDESSLFFWARRQEITLDTVFNLVSASNSVKHVHIHKALDPEQKFIEPSSELKFSITQSEWFENKEELNNTIQNSALYMAPRIREGIGMSFLEAMAQGRCVIAPNNPTMNEYIKDGVTGFLYEYGLNRPIPIANVRTIQKQTLEAVKQGRKIWEAEKYKILDWMNEVVKLNSTPLPKVTIVTCSYNIIAKEREKFFNQAVNSILSQEYSGEIEYLIIDGGSTDGTVELIKKIADEVDSKSTSSNSTKFSFKWISEQDRGIYFAMNKAIDLATGEYIAFLNSDDLYCSNSAVRDSIFRILMANADGSYADACIINADSEVIGKWEGSIRLLPFGNYPNHQTVFMRTSVLKEIGGFDTSFIGIADNALFCTALGMGKKLVRLCKEIVHFRQGGFTEEASSDIFIEKSFRANEMFHKFFVPKLSYRESMLLYCFAFLAKDSLFYLGEHLPYEDWRKEFYKALFTKKSDGLIKMVETSTSNN